MITNETRAKLIHPDHRVVTIKGGYNEADRRVLTSQPDGPERLDMETVKSFAYTTDANAVADLRAFVRARGEMRTFVDALIKVLHDEWRSEDRDHRAGFTETRFDLIDATPAQQTAAFDAVFKSELEKL